MAQSPRGDSREVAVGFKSDVANTYVPWEGNPTTGAGKVDLADSTIPLPTGAATSAKQLADGHAVTVDNSTGGAAVNIQDGGNSITIDGTVTTEHPITGIVDGVTTVTTAGTDVVLAASTACKRVIIQAQSDNTNIIAVGATGVDATLATGTGTVLYPGDAIDFEIDNLADIYIDSLVNGEGVRWTALT